MESLIVLPLLVSPGHAQRLANLQEKFAEASNFLAPQVCDTRCWNRVALHHLAYKALRERFPELGSQMACNVIYAVSRAARIVYQHPGSPWNVVRHPQSALPLLRFSTASPVYFDRHTLSLKDGRFSLFTLEGRLYFRLDLAPDVMEKFAREKLREIALKRQGEAYALQFRFGSGEERRTRAADWHPLPDYLAVRPSGGSLPLPAQAGPILETA